MLLPSYCRKTVSRGSAELLRAESSHACVAPNCAVSRYGSPPRTARHFASRVTTASPASFVRHCACYTKNLMFEILTGVSLYSCHTNAGARVFMRLTVFVTTVVLRITIVSKIPQGPIPLADVLPCASTGQSSKFGTPAREEISKFVTPNTTGRSQSPGRTPASSRIASADALALCGFANHS